ncbi:MAG: hypothetical protein IPP13_21510 [Kouleothrix sp.]|jgi:DNA-binding protein Fis|nr:hypothetical protein [Kouleothrix sp.]
MTKVNFFTTARRVAIVEPMKAVLEHGNQALITGAAAYMSAMFSMQHDVLPAWVAVPLAVGFEWTYLRGLANADKAGRSRWAGALNWSAMVTSVVYGILFILGHYAVITAKPDGWTAFWLANAHVLPMSILSFCSANLRRVHKQREFERERAKIEDAERAAREQADLERELERKRKELHFEMEAKWREAQLAESVRGLRKNRVTANSSSTNQAVRDSVRPDSLGETSSNVPSASGTQMNSVHEQSGEQLREHIVRTLREHPKTNKSQLAEQLGIGRTRLYEFINEAKLTGDLN